MTSALTRLATADATAVREARAFRSRLPLALACFAAAIVFATVAAASRPLMSWMGAPYV